MARPTLGTTDLAKAPTTPMRIVMGIVAAFIYVMVLIGCMVAQVPVSLPLATLIGSFILLQEGMDLGQWGLKRVTDYGFQKAKRGAPAVEVTADQATITAEIETPAAVPAAGSGAAAGQLPRDD